MDAGGRVRVVKGGARPATGESTMKKRLTTRLLQNAHRRIVDDGPRLTNSHYRDLVTAIECDCHTVLVHPSPRLSSRRTTMS